MGRSQEAKKVTSKGGDTPQELLQPRVQSLVVPKRHTEAGLHPWADTLRLRDH